MKLSDDPYENYRDTRFTNISDKALLDYSYKLWNLSFYVGKDEGEIANEFVHAALELMRREVK